MTAAEDRIAITGCGMVSALGIGAAEGFDALVAGQVAFAPASRLPGEGSPRLLVARVPIETNEGIAASARHRWTRSDRLALVAAREAWHSAGLAAADGDWSLVVGASTGGTLEAELGAVAAGPGAAVATLARSMVEAPVSQTAERIAEVLGGARRKLTLCSACSSGAAAIAVGAAWLEDGRAERVLVGGVDSLCLLTLSGFNALGVLDPVGSRPFDATRAGLTLGEGAGFLVLERAAVARARGAPIRGWLSGWSLAAEAYHVTQPEPSGTTAVRLMRGALVRAGLEPERIDYLNAHGTGTLQNDAMEAGAIHAFFGPAGTSPPISSVKGQLGHTLAAAGAIEAVVTVLAVERGMLPPTGGLCAPDPALGDLHHVIGQGRPAAIEAAMSSSYGFGGAGTVLVFERAGAARRPAGATATAGRTVVSGLVAWHGEARSGGEDVVGIVEGHTDAQLPSLEALAAGLSPDRSRRFDQLSALTTAGTGLLLDGAGLSPDGIGLVVGLTIGAVERSARYLERVIVRGSRLASPAEFPQLILSAASGNASVYHGLTGPVVTVSDRRASAEDALLVADTLVRGGLAPAVLVAALAVPDPLAKAEMAAVYPAVESGRVPCATFLLLEAEAAAAARGRRPMAVVSASDTVERVRFRAADLPQPTKQRAQLLISSPTLPGQDVPLELEEWAGGRSASFASCPVDGELGAGTALAVAAALVSSGAAQEVLVVHFSEGWVRWSHLVEIVPRGGTTG